MGAKLSWDSTQQPKRKERWLLTHAGERELSSLISTASSALARRRHENFKQEIDLSEESLKQSGMTPRPRCDHHTTGPKGLRVASDVLGQQARGPVTLGIRVKAVSRMAIAGALRQVLHLRAGRDTSEESELWSPGRSQHPALWRVRSDVSEADTLKLCPSESSFEEEVPADTVKRTKSPKIQQPPVREVLANTTLGKMVKADEARAAKFGLVVVPPWSHNKPWPPPPVVCHFSSQPSDWALALQAKTEERKRREEEQQ
eukprot:g21213.t1